MNKIAVVFAAAGLMALAACGEKPAAEANNASNTTVVNEAETQNAVSTLNSAANTMANAANTMNATAHANAAAAGNKM